MFKEWQGLKQSESDCENKLIKGEYKGMTTPRQFEKQMIEAVENGENNTQIVALCVKVMVETLDSLGYHAGTEILKEYVDCV